MIDHKLMQGSETQVGYVNFGYKFNVLFSVSLLFGCNSFSTYEIMENILSPPGFFLNIISWRN